MENLNKRPFPPNLANTVCDQTVADLPDVVFLNEKNSLHIYPTLTHKEVTEKVGLYSGEAVFKVATWIFICLHYSRV